MDTSRENLLKHYRSCVKCHCNDGDKERVLPCGHASCKKVRHPCSALRLRRARTPASLLCVDCAAAATEERHCLLSNEEGGMCRKRCVPN